MTCPASFTQVTFRGRNDDGNETTATWKDVAGADWTQKVDTNFRIRFVIQEGANCAGNNKVWRLQYNLAGAGWVDCSASSIVVWASASGNLADGAATTDQLAGTGTFQGGSPTTGGFDEGDCNAGGASMDLAALGHCEPEFCVQIRSADVTNGQTLQLRVTDAGTAIAAYTDTPTITVNEPSAAISGTITASVNEADIVTGGKTLIITLTGDTWIAAGAASFDLQRDEIIAGCTSAQSEALGWNLVPKALQTLGPVVRTSDTIVTITWDAFATYNITANETITVTVPSTATVGANTLVATPTFTVAFTAAATDIGAQFVMIPDAMGIDGNQMILGGGGLRNM